METEAIIFSDVRTGIFFGFKVFHKSGVRTYVCPDVPTDILKPACVTDGLPMKPTRVLDS